MLFKVAPLKSSFMLIAIIGLLISIIYTVYGKLSQTWGFTIGLVCVLMIVAALISMSNADIDEQLEMNHPKAKPAKK